MLTTHVPFTLSNPHWYDVPWAPESPLLATSITPPPAPGWQRSVAGPWEVFRAPGDLPATFGWKVHISALPGCAIEAIGITSRWCQQNDVTYKVLRSRELVHATQLKYADPSTSGKVITCYPSAEQLAEFSTDLGAQLRHIQGPPITGELNLPGTPVWFRFGSFVEDWGFDSDGDPVPVITMGAQQYPDGRGRSNLTQQPEPEFITATRANRPPSPALPITQPSLLHRSNGGGVYKAVWKDGLNVVLKEARPHSGLDAKGVDASTRLRHERDVLSRLAGSGAAPELIDYIETDHGDVLVMQHLPYLTMMQTLSRLHPLIARGPAALSPEAFRVLMDTIDAQLERLISILESRNVVHGDLQPANLLLLPDSLAAVDFETATLDGHGVSHGIGTPGISRAGTEQLDDRTAAGRVSTLMLNPVAGPLLMHDQDVESAIRSTALADLYSRSLDETRTIPTKQLVEGIGLSATPTRKDRLFPADPAQFRHPTATLGLLHGAAGVLMTLQELGHPVDPAHLDWLAERVMAQRTYIPGLADGTHGLALALCRLGRADLADYLASRARLGARPLKNPTLGNGTAGQAIALQQLARELDRTDLQKAADQCWDQLASSMRGTPTALANGLFTGWEGIGLALLNSPLSNRTELAELALQRALAGTTVLGGALLARQPGIAWPYLGKGALACGPLAAALGATDSIVQSAVATCHTKQVHGSGLLNGRAGLLLVLAHLAPDDPMVGEHASRLCSYVTVDPATGAHATLGDYGIRSSVDVATGSCGILLATNNSPWLHFMHILGIIQKG